MSRPTLEVADIVRASGNRFWEHHRSHFAWQHRKVHALRPSGHLVQLVPEQALPKMPGERTFQMDGRASG